MFFCDLAFPSPLPFLHPPIASQTRQQLGHHFRGGGGVCGAALDGALCEEAGSLPLERGMKGVPPPPHAVTVQIQKRVREVSQIPLRGDPLLPPFPLRVLERAASAASL